MGQIIPIVIALVAACWVIVFGHWLGFIDTEAYTIWQASLPIAYMGAFGSLLSIVGYALIKARG